MSAYSFECALSYIIISKSLLSFLPIHLGISTCPFPSSRFSQLREFDLKYYFELEGLVSFSIYIGSRYSFLFFKITLDFSHYSKISLLLRVSSVPALAGDRLVLPRSVLSTVSVKVSFLGDTWFSVRSFALRLTGVSTFTLYSVSSLIRNS